MDTTKEKIAILWIPISTILFTFIAWKWSFLIAFKFEYILSTFLFFPLKSIPVLSIEHRAILIAGLVLPILFVIAIIPYVLVTEHRAIKKHLSKTLNTIMILTFSYLILYLVNNTFSVSNFVQDILKVEKINFLIIFLTIQIVFINIIYKFLKTIERKVNTRLRKEEELN